MRAWSSPARIAGLLLCLLVALTACGGSDSDGAGKDPAEIEKIDTAAYGPLVEGDGYRFNLPDGWRASGAGGRAKAKTAGVRSQVSASVEAYGRDLDDDELDSFQQAVLTRLKPQLPEPTALAPVLLDEERAVRFEGIARSKRTATSPGRQRYYTQQVTTERDGDIYTLTFSFDPKSPEGARTELIRSVIGSWRWREAG